jgi:hypothetical protein
VHRRGDWVQSFMHAYMYLFARAELAQCCDSIRCPTHAYVYLFARAELAQCLAAVELPFCLCMRSSLSRMHACVCLHMQSLRSAWRRLSWTTCLCTGVVISHTCIYVYVNMQSLRSAWRRLSCTNCLCIAVVFRSHLSCMHTCVCLNLQSLRSA